MAKRSGPRRFAEGFSALLSQVAKKYGKARFMDLKRATEFATDAIRSSRGDLETLTGKITAKVAWLVLGKDVTLGQDTWIRERSRVFVRRYRLAVAEQVLAGNTDEKPEADGRRPIMLMQPAVVAMKRKGGRLVGR